MLMSSNSNMLTIFSVFTKLPLTIKIFFSIIKGVYK